MQKRSILRLLEYPGIYIRVHSLLVAVAVPVCATPDFRSVFFSINFTRKVKNEEPFLGFPFSGNYHNRKGANKWAMAAPRL